MKVKASRFDREFDEGKDVSRYLETQKARRPGLEQRRVGHASLLRWPGCGLITIFDIDCGER